MTEFHDVTGLQLLPALRPGTRVTIGGLPEGLDAGWVTYLARKRNGPVLHIARDDARARAFAEAVRFFDPALPVLDLPAWDCQPYDRVSPRAGISAQRMATLAALAKLGEGAGPLLINTTVNAALQRVPPRSVLKASSFHAKAGGVLDLDALIAFLGTNGFARASTVMEPGDFAVRGGIVDIFPPTTETPVRLDLFGDTLESIRTFDTDSQRTTGQLRQLDLVPVGEVILTDETVTRFRKNYVSLFGAVTQEDPLYEAISAQRKHQGMEHWLPLFYEGLETVFDYAGEAAVTLENLAEDARDKRLETILDTYEARKEFQGKKTAGFSSPAYNPVSTEQLYLTAADWNAALDRRVTAALSPFQLPDAAARDAGGRKGRNFAPERKQENTNVFDALASHVDALKAGKKRVLIAAWSRGSGERMRSVLSDHGFDDIREVHTLEALNGLPAGVAGWAAWGLEAGFEAPKLAVIAEQDVLGDKLVRRAKAKKGANVISEAAALNPEDLIVHEDFGIGRFLGLETIDVAGAPHDCLRIVYHGGDKLYLPVENIELLTRYGSDDPHIQLDRLGGSGWQSRKAKLKQRIRDMADKLIRVAAERQLKAGQKLHLSQGLYDEFAARFPYDETEDQEKAIGDVMEDLSSGKAMDRLVCGDVGFGKTEVALRAAHIAAMDGQQVAAVVPTTLLARQHYKTFTERFSGLPLNIAQLSRMVGAKDAGKVRAGLADGSVDIVIGTHALLSKNIEFKNLGLLIIDEEQHFGVSHKERLKSLKANVHVLTLTATPIPRTLQLAMSGVRDLSIIATPPVDRLAVRTYVSSFDPVVVREALLRELYRGGQSFFVCPRISDLKEASEFLEEVVPEVKFVVAHGQMAAGALDDVMNAFYDRKYDVLVSTTIVESGLDIPTANTMIVHRADMFGLAQLYQLRGRIGRSKTRAYCYLTVPQKKLLTANAEKRLKVLQSLDTLGAGFTLASHDLDIRGAGNLLGEEQSGHVREVGIELYQSMLEEAMANLRAGEESIEMDGRWSPQINIGTAVLIPEDYVSDLNVRMALYRRLAELETKEEVEGFAAELIDRFGDLPPEVQSLLDIVVIKQFCRRAGVEKLDAGPKGLTVSFRNNKFANPQGLVEFISLSRIPTKIRPDHKLFYGQGADDPEQRLEDARRLVTTLAEIAEAEAEAA